MRVRAFLTILIGETLEFFSVGQSMSAQQIAQTIDLILDDDHYFLMKPDYFILCFKRAKKGDYGKQYNRIDGQIIFEWLTQFDYEYVKEIEQERINEKKRAEHINVGIPEFPKGKEPVIDEKDKPVPMPDYIKEMFKTIAKEESMPVKVFERTPEQLIVDGYIADFDRLTKDDMTPGKRFITIDGKKLDISEYIELRLTNENL